jgi:Fic family protein
MPVLVKAGMAHVQFETIHPFLDGNGRVGRLLITLMLCVDGLLEEPLLYLSLFLKRHRSLYYDLLQRVRLQGAWEEWLDFFLEGVEETATQAEVSARTALKLLEEDREALRESGRATGTMLLVHDWFRRHPIATITSAAQGLGLTKPPVSRAIEHMVQRGMVAETTGRRRGRVFAYRRYLDLLAEGTDPLPR